MNQENDFIEREVKKIILFLKSLLSKISGATSQTEKSVIKDLDVELREKLALSFFDFLALEKQALKSKVEEIDVLILENLIFVFYEIYKNENIAIEKNNLKKILLVMLDVVNNTSRTFSFERQQIKNNLKL